jgi:4-diphosphocytidyl-2-C-methyl-D-erythritol kinase
MPDPALPTAASRRVAPVIRLAPAKLNLTLAVLGRRPDGYHELHSVMVLLALTDRLSLARAAAGHDTLRVEGLDAGPPGDNLVLRAIATTRVAVGRAADPFPLAARLEKRIPVAAGLAGGSSDAAAAIDGALEAWGLVAPGVPPDGEVAALRAAVAARVGSDVPFFLAGGAALVEGRGERVQPLAPISGTAPGVLLVTPAVAASTPAVFAAYDGGGTAAPADPRSTRLTSEHLATEFRAGLSAASLVARAGVLASANDLASAAGIVVPGLANLRRAMARRLGRPVGVSGSGPTLWVLYPSGTAAATAAAEIRDGIAEGSIVAPGDRAPSVIASSIAGAPADGASSPRTGHAAEGRT